MCEAVCEQEMYAVVFRSLCEYGLVVAVYPVYSSLPGSFLFDIIVDDCQV